MSFIAVWLGVMFPIVFSPGPANVVFAASGVQVGFKRSLPLMLGIDAVLFIKSIIVGLGFGVVFERLPAVLHGVQFIGAFYLVYLALSFLKVKTKKTVISTRLYVLKMACYFKSLTPRDGF